MATASALGEFTTYINKFWGATDIIVRYGNGQPFENGNATTVQNNPQVRQTAQRLSWIASLDNATVFQLVGVDPKTDFDYSSFNITGTSTVSPDQAVVDGALVQKYTLHIGSTIKIFTKILTQTFPFLRNTTISVRIVGINYPLRNLGSAVYVYLPQLQSDLNLQGQITHIYATLYDPTKAIQVQGQLQNALSRSFDVSAPKAEAVQRIQGQTAGFQLGLNAMIAVSLVVCSFIVFNTLFMTVSERTYEIGVMRAVGSSRNQIFRIFLTEGLLIGAIGTTTGVLAGLALARLFTTIFETSFDLPGLPQAQLTPIIALTGIGAGFAAVLAGALYPAFSASRTNIIQAIRPSARNTPSRVPQSGIALAGVVMLGVGVGQSLRLTPFHVSYLDVVLVPIGLVVLGGVLFGKMGRLLTAPMVPFSRAVSYAASKSGRRRLLRNAVSFGMITITLSFAIMIGGIQSGVQQALQQGIQEALGADIILVANQSIPISFTNNLTSIAQVSAATPLGPSILPSKAFGSNGNNSAIGVLAVDPSEFPNIISYTFVNSPPESQVYSELRASNESLMVPDVLASRLGVRAGDSLKILTYNDTQVNFRVAGVFTGPVLQYIRFGDYFASDAIVVSFKSQQKYFGGQFNAPLFLVNLKAQDKPQATSVAHDISNLFPKYDFAENSITLGELLSLVNSTINRIFALILLILYFALLIASLGISATMIMNVTDRRREIGLLRSQGMSMGQITGLFLGEGVLLGLFGFLLAIPGGLLLLKGATNSTTIAGFFIPFIVPYGAIFQAFLLALVAVLLGSFYPAVRASRMEITRALEQV